ncbi:hypothetical protein ACX80D_16960 [Arthrobacter sp. Sr24]
MEAGSCARHGHRRRDQFAINEVVGIREDGSLIPSATVGKNRTWLDRADAMIIEVLRDSCGKPTPHLTGEALSGTSAASALH